MNGMKCHPGYCERQALLEQIEILTAANEQLTNERNDAQAEADQLRNRGQDLALKNERLVARVKEIKDTAKARLRSKNDRIRQIEDDRDATVAKLDEMIQNLKTEGQKRYKELEKRATAAEQYLKDAGVNADIAFYLGCELVGYLGQIVGATAVGRGDNLLKTLPEMGDRLLDAVKNYCEWWEPWAPAHANETRRRYDALQDAIKKTRNQGAKKGHPLEVWVKRQHDEFRGLIEAGRAEETRGRKEEPHTMLIGQFANEYILANPRIKFPFGIIANKILIDWPKDDESKRMAAEKLKKSTNHPDFVRRCYNAYIDKTSTALVKAE